MPIDYYAVKQQARREQRRWNSVPWDAVFCACCGRATASQLHHWLFHGRKTYPESILHDIRNVAWVCNDCHIPEHPELKERCCRLKIARGYDIRAWVNELYEQGIIKEKPEIPTWKPQCAAGPQNEAPPVAEF